MGNNLKSLRLEFNLSMKKLSNRVHIDDSTIAKIETGVREIYRNHIEPLCHFFDVTSDYLLGRTDKGIYACFEGDTNKKQLTLEQVKRFSESNDLYYVEHQENGVLVKRRILRHSVSNDLMNETLHEIYNSDKAQSQMLDEIFGSTGSLRKLIDNIIYISNADEEKLSTIYDLTNLIRSMLEK